MNIIDKVKNEYDHCDLSEVECAIKTIDNILIHAFFKYCDNLPARCQLPNCVIDGLELIAQARKNNPNFPITKALANYMRREEFLE